MQACPKVDPSATTAPAAVSAARDAHVPCALDFWPSGPTGGDERVSRAAHEAHVRRLGGRFLVRVDGALVLDCVDLATAEDAADAALGASPDAHVVIWWMPDEVERVEVEP